MALASTAAARALAKARWGSTRVDGLVAELRDRRAELGDVQLAGLRELVETDEEDDE